MVRIRLLSDVNRTTARNTRDCFGSRKLRTLFDMWNKTYNSEDGFCKYNATLTTS